MMQLICSILYIFSIEVNIRNERKRVFRISENAYLCIKNPRASRANLKALDSSPIWLTLLT